MNATTSLIPIRTGVVSNTMHMRFQSGYPKPPTEGTHFENPLAAVVALPADTWSHCLLVVGVHVDISIIDMCPGQRTSSGLLTVVVIAFLAYLGPLAFSVLAKPGSGAKGYVACL